MTATDDLDAMLEAERRTFANARTILRQKLGSGPDEQLIGAAKFGGPAEALAEFFSDPAAFGYDGELDVIDLEDLKPSLDRAYKAELEMMRIVNAREAALCSVDPERPRVRIHLGREYVMDRSNKKMRFLDDDQTLDMENSRSRSL